MEIEIFAKYACLILNKKIRKHKKHEKNDFLIDASFRFKVDK